MKIYCIECRKEIRGSVIKHYRDEHPSVYELYYNIDTERT